MLSLSKEVIIAQLESPEEFPVRLSEVWGLLGYSSEANAVRGFFGIEFVEDLDYRTSTDGAVRLSVDALVTWAMLANTIEADTTRRFYRQVEKEWRAAKSVLTQEQVEAYAFFRTQYEPWASSNPGAASVFFELALGAKQKPPAVEEKPPVDEMEALLEQTLGEIKRVGWRAINGDAKTINGVRWRQFCEWPSEERWAKYRAIVGAKGRKLTQRQAVLLWAVRNWRVICKDLGETFRLEEDIAQVERKLRVWTVSCR